MINQNKKKELLELISFERVVSSSNLKRRDANETINEEDYEMVFSEEIQLKAKVKNPNAYSFVNLVMSTSNSDTDLVYTRESTDQYKCSVTAEYQDEILVSVITFDFEACFDDELTNSIELKEINFLKNETVSVETDVLANEKSKLAFLIDDEAYTLLHEDNTEKLNYGEMHWYYDADQYSFHYTLEEEKTSDYKIDLNGEYVSKISLNHTIVETELSIEKLYMLLRATEDSTIEVTLPDEYTHIENCFEAVRANKLTVNLPDELTKIDDFAFQMLNVEDFVLVYNGTMAKWNSLDISDFLISESYLTTAKVICTDGEIDLMTTFVEYPARIYAGLVNVEKYYYDYDNSYEFVQTVYVMEGDFSAVTEGSIYYITDETGSFELSISGYAAESNTISSYTFQKFIDKKVRIYAFQGMVYQMDIIG